MKKTIFSLFAAVVLVSALGVMKAEAASQPVSGWAWSDTIGWIQFATGVASPVTIDDVSGNWAGYAWSDNIGWISFNSNSCGAQANVNVSTGAVSGWAKALSADGNGWDGCIELAGTNHTTSGGGGVTLNTATGNFSGYAWGSDVVGWVQFNTSSPVSVSITPGPSGLSVTCTAPAANVNLPSTGGTVAANASASGGTAPYQYQWDNGSGVFGAYGAFGVSSATLTYLSNPGPTPIVYTPVVRARDSAASPATAVGSCASTVTVAAGSAPVPTVSLKIGNTAATANFNTLKVKQGKPFAIKWTNSLPGGPTYDYECAPSYSPVSSGTNWNASWSGLDQTGFSGTGNTAALTTNSSTNVGAYVFTLSCTDNNAVGDSASGTAQVNVIQSSENEI